MSGSTASAVDSGVSSGLWAAGLVCSPGAMPAGAMYELVDREKNLNATFEPVESGEGVRLAIQHSREGSGEDTLFAQNLREIARLSNCSNSGRLFSYC